MIAAGTRSRFERGEIIAGRYEVEELLGVGGMGLVFAAMHLQLRERVAIKVLLPQTAERPEAVARFLREARAAAKIKSEHVARVSDFGTLESGEPFLVMEHLDGQDLATLASRNGPLPIREAVELVLQACEALAEAHALGIVHRDLKPANLFVIRRPDGTPCVKVLDFGISKLTKAELTGTDASLTQTASVMGSPLYMSPEQIRSANTVDGRADIWALGVTLFHLLTGSAPFDAPNLPELSVKIAVDEPLSPRSLRPDVPPGLEATLLRCLEKAPARRFQTVAELADALTPYGPARAHISAERARAVLDRAGMRSDAPSEPPSPRFGGTPKGTAFDVSGTVTVPGSPLRGRLNRWLWVGAALAGGVALAVLLAGQPSKPGASTKQSPRALPPTPQLVPGSQIVAPKPREEGIRGSLPFATAALASAALPPASSQPKFRGSTKPAAPSAKPRSFAAGPPARAATSGDFKGDRTPSETAPAAESASGQPTPPTVFDLRKY